MIVRTTSLIFMALLLVGCSSRAPKRFGNTLIYGRGEDTKTLDPINAETGESVKLLVNLYDTIVAFADDSMEIEPSLATSWETSEDGLTWTFFLREGVRFHDGTPFNADAVVFSMNRLLQVDNPNVSDPARPYMPSYQIIDEVSAVSPLSVMFRLREPSAVFLNNLAMFPAGIVSPAAVKKLGKGFSTHPVGTGPFRFERWNRDQQLVIAANKDHWRGRPHFDRVVFVPVSESATRIQQLVRGEIHIADNLPPAELDELEKNPNLTVPEEISMNVGYLAMQTEKPPLNDIRVRQAIAMALDKQALIRVAYAGHADAATNLLPKAMWGHNDKIKDRPFDIQASREQLEAALKDQGFELPLTLSLAVMSEPRPYMEQPLQVAAFVKDSLKKIGINVTIEPKPVTPHFTKMMRGDFQIGLAGWTTDNGDPDNFLYSLLDSDNISESGNNMSRYRNDKVHELLLAGQRELDQDKRLVIYHEVQELIFADVPIVPLVSTKQRAAHTKRIKDYRLHPAMLIRLRNARFEDMP
jgi:ABC-type transport system substrate-binding protein